MENYFYVPGKAIKHHRINKKLTQEQLGAIMGITRVQMTGWEGKESVKLTKQELEALAGALGVKTNDLTNVSRETSEPDSISKDSETIYRDLIEKNTEYRLIPKTILDEEYRIILKSEIELKEQMLKDLLDAKNDLIKELKQEIADLKLTQRAVTAKQAQ